MFERLSLKTFVSAYWNLIYLSRWGLTLVIMVYVSSYYSF